MEIAAAQLLDNSVAASTRRSYNSAQQQYYHFCQSIGFRPCVPATEHVLILFVTHLAQKCCHSTIRSYLSAVRFLHIVNGQCDPLQGKLRLEQLLKGVKRIKPKASDPRLPITPFILQKIHSVITQDAHSPLKVMMWAAGCLGYFAFLRAGEFTLQTNSHYNPEIHISPADIAVDSHHEPTLMRIHIKQSKTDQTRMGVDLYVGRTFNNLCPVAAMLAYLALRGQAEGPLFLIEGKCLTRDMLVHWLRSTLTKAGVDPTHFSGHSFRIGAASTAAARGVAESTVQLLGRWASDSYKRYIRIPREELASISQTLAN